MARPPLTVCCGMLRMGVAVAVYMCHAQAHMKRTNFFYPPELLDRLKALKASTGLPVSEHIRRAIEDYLKRHKA